MHSGFIWMCGCPHMFVFMCVEIRLNLSCYSLEEIHLCFPRQGLFLGSGPCSQLRPADQQVPGAAYLHHYSVMYTIIPSFNRRSGDTNSGVHACTADSLPSQRLTSPDYVFFIKKPLWGILLQQHKTDWDSWLGLNLPHTFWIPVDQCEQGHCSRG